MHENYAYVLNESSKKSFRYYDPRSFETYYIWDKVFKNEPSKICRRQPLKKGE